jgi:hypothetical protein
VKSISTKSHAVETKSATKPPKGRKMINPVRTSKPIQGYRLESVGMTMDIDKKWKANRETKWSV